MQKQGKRRRIPLDQAADEKRVWEAVEALSPEDWYRLKRVARRYAYGDTGIAPEDVLQEAILAAADPEEDRRWDPQNISFSTFLFGAMRSRASHRHEAQERRAASTPEMAQEANTATPEETPPAADCDEAVRQLMKKDILEDLDMLLESDSVLRDVYDGKAAGMSASEIQEALGQPLKEFDAARKRLDRHLERFIEKHRKRYE